jgi:uncharacterized membrane protein YbhN (UPF0104 family)
MTAGSGIEAGGVPAREKRRGHMRHTARALIEARGQLKKRLLKLLGFALFVYVVLKVIPGLENALKSLKGIDPWWLLLLLGVEVFSEMGYVVSWRGILDPEGLLQQGGRGRHLGARVAWAQLGGGMVVPGGTIGSMGVGAVMLHRLGMSMDRVAERQFILMFLNTAVDALAIVFFGVLTATGLFSEDPTLALTLGPAVVVAALIVFVLVFSRHAERYLLRHEERRPKLAKAAVTLTAAVEGTDKLLRHRGGLKIVLGAVAYLGFDMLVLWGSFAAIGAEPRPTFAIVALSYLIGGLAGSIPLPANLGAVTGMAGMLVVFGINKNNAIAAVVLYQAVGFLVPLIGGGIAYLFLRREFGSGEDLVDDEEDEAVQPAPA